MNETSTAILLDYQLTDADVRHYCLRGRFGKCWHACRKRKLSVLVLAGLALFFVATCYLFHSFRTGTLALGTTLVILGLLFWARQAWADRRVCRLARELGLPLAIRLQVSSRGIVKEPGLDPDDVGRIYSWSDVVRVFRIDGQTIVHLRPGGSVLIVPDRAFAGSREALDFAASARAWREAVV